MANTAAPSLEDADILGPDSRQRVLAVWRLAAAMLVPDATLTEVPADPRQATALAVRRLLEPDATTAEPARTAATQAVRTGFVHAGQSGDARLAWVARLAGLDLRRFAVLETVAVSALDPEVALVARWLAARLGHAEPCGLACLDEVLAAAGLGAAAATVACQGSGSLIDWGLLRRTADGLAPSAALLRFLLGPDACASDLAPFVTAAPLNAAFDEQLGREQAPSIAALRERLAAGLPVVLSGNPGFGGPWLAAHVAAGLGVAAVTVDLDAVFDSERGLPTELLAVLRAECHLSAAVWCLDGAQKLETALRSQPRALARLAESLRGWRRPLVLLHQGPLGADVAAQIALHGGWPHIEVPALTAEMRERLLTVALQQGVTPAEAKELAVAARSFSLAPQGIVTAAAHALHRAHSRGLALPTLRDVHLACSAALTSRLRQYGSRVDTTASWDDLVLADEPLRQVKELARFARVRDKLFDTYGFGNKLAYGRALSAMFSGPSGTGKTMVAGLIARDLGVELYRVDLSRVVSKYIGETEERLGALFSEASQVGAALLFDEADSLFGARTEIKSSNDRYANLEVNYLLQRLEEYDGVVILTTNFAASIDEAFVRRLRFRVQFPLPSPKERARLWEVMLPAEMPQDDEGIDFAWLGETFELSGGHVRNAVLRAAMVAADADKALTNRMVYDAAAAEYRELGKLAPPYPFDDNW